MRALKSALAAALTLFFAMPSYAKTVTGDVPAGKTSQIYSIIFYNKELCTTLAIPKLGTIKAKNGSITASKGRAKMPDARCKGKTFNALRVFYKPNAGFRGKEKASIVLVYPKYDDVTGYYASKVKFNLDVK